MREMACDRPSVSAQLVSRCSITLFGKVLRPVLAPLKHFQRERLSSRFSHSCQMIFLHRPIGFGIRFKEPACSEELVGLRWQSELANADSATTDAPDSPSSIYRRVCPTDTPISPLEPVEQRVGSFHRGAGCENGLCGELISFFGSTKPVVPNVQPPRSPMTMSMASRLKGSDVTERGCETIGTTGGRSCVGQT